MWLMESMVVVVFACVCVRLCSCVTVVPDEPKVQDSSENITYRVSAPKTKRPSNRVPSHLQDIHLGYVYDDADDVIHIIEPPKHFQALKRLINQKGEAAVWEQQRKVRINRPQIATTATAGAASMLEMQPQLKVKDRINAAKVELPPRARLGVKPAVAAGSAAIGGDGADKSTSGGDLLTQETKLQPENQIQHLHFPPQLPMEILASVRNTKRFIQQQQQQQRPLSPSPKQRIKTRRVHTVIMEKSFQRDNFQHGKEHRVGGEKIRRTRARRDLQLKYPAQQLQSLKSGYAQKLHQTSSFATELRQKRRKREVSQDNATSVQQAENSDHNNQKANKLLLHIAELLQNATTVLPNAAVRKIESLKGIKANATTLRELQARFQHDTQPKQLIGEIEPAYDTHSAVANNLWQERDLYKILENSVNATDAILNELMHKRNVRDAALGCTSMDDSAPNNRFRQLQHRIDCMREQLLLQSRGSPPIGSRAKKRFGERIRGKEALPPPASNSASFHGLKVRAPQTESGSNLATIPNSAAVGNALDAYNITESLLYDDVMSNIRNMLQAYNLRLLEQQLNAATTVDTNAANLSAEPPRDASPAEMERVGDLKDLHQHLHELQQMVARLPRTATLPNATASVAENGPESVLSSSDANQADWYLINGEGKIYAAHLDDPLKSTASIFHRFPDIPSAEAYVHNSTLSTELANSFDMF